MKCSICGRRIPLTLTVAITFKDGTSRPITGYLLTRDSTDWCVDHVGAPVPSQPQRQVVPKAFYDAFQQEEKG